MKNKDNIILLKRHVISINSCLVIRDILCVAIKELLIGILTGNDFPAQSELFKGTGLNEPQNLDLYTFL